MLDYQTVLYSNGYDKQPESHGTIKVLVQTRCEVDIMFRNEWVKKIPQHGDFFTIQKNVFAHKHRLKNKVNYNHFHNILRLFDVLPNCPFTTSETMDNYYL